MIIPDQAQRTAAILERAGNVLVDAGAGTGKTTLLANRLIEMLAPTSGAPPIPLERIAAITFTRRAAGELKLRIRERLFSELAEPALTDARRQLLRTALTGLDTAHISTIHSFCDRLLRLRPVEAGLSPSYDIAEDASLLVRETYDILLSGSQSGRLAAELAGSTAAELAEEAQSTIIEALEAGLRTQTVEREWDSLLGLAALVEAFILQRDVTPPLPPPPAFELRRFRNAAREFIEGTGKLAAGSAGADWARRLGSILEDLLEEREPAALWSAIAGRPTRGPHGQSNAQKKEDFNNDADGWNFWKAYDGDKRKEPVRARPLRDDLLSPLRAYFAQRLVRLFPVVVAIYEKVKARHQQLDQIDLLQKTRELLAKDKASRTFYQSLFDHILVDEFQDTDPLQAEIVLFLCEDGAKAKRWSDAKVAAGKLTLVGDPKQSIYRFRRADIAMYEQVRALVAQGPHLAARLSTNFRSERGLIEFVNDRFKHLLGEAKEGEPLFDALQGTVRYQPLEHPRRDEPQACVHALPLMRADGTGADAMRDVEAAALAHYLRWLVETSDVRVQDPSDGQRRRPRYGDIAVLAISTFGMQRLFTQLDAFGVPHAARGGKLFLGDPLHRQFLLALRAIADKDDGVAQAALLRPPFFAIDLSDLLHEKAVRAELPQGTDPARVARAQEALAIVRKLRAGRFDRPPGETARDLLEQSALGRTVALGPNGEQRLARLNELCSMLDGIASEQRIDFDAATAVLRSWVDKPAQLDPPAPVGAEAVQIITVHQAKGLEFPVVVLWDGMGRLATQEQGAAFRVERDGRGWSLAIDGLKWEEPEELGLAATEQRFRNAERKRVVYVATTRARDLLVIPQPVVGRSGQHIHATLLDSAGLVETLAPYDFEAGAPWAIDIEATEEREIESSSVEAAPLDAIATEAARPRFVPRAVSGAAHDAIEALPHDPDALPPPRRESRFGNVFGQTVHLAISLGLEGRAPAEAVRVAAQETGLRDHLDEAAGDVARTLATLRREGLAVGAVLEYPVAGPGEAGTLLTGYIDLLAADERRLRVIDFKTDAPPSVAVQQAYPAYVEQVRLYARLLQQAPALAALEAQTALLFTADGSLHWVPA